jgi:hypothetical protein
MAHKKNAKKCELLRELIDRLTSVNEAIHIARSLQDPVRVVVWNEHDRSEAAQIDVIADGENWNELRAVLLNAFLRDRRQTQKAIKRELIA